MDMTGKMFWTFAVAIALAACSHAGAVELECGRVEVVVAQHSPGTTLFAGEEATNFLSRILGGDVPLVRRPTQDHTSIVLGTNEWSVSAGIDVKGLVRDGFRIAAQGDRVYIAGQDDFRNVHKELAEGGRLTFRCGTLFGVYEFLERFAGVRFYFPGELGTIVPSRKRFNVDGDVTETPNFPVRDCYLSGAGAYPGVSGDLETRRAKLLYSMRLRECLVRPYCCHGQNRFRIPERFSDTHPEYFQRRKDGTRCTGTEFKYPWWGRQLCQSSAVWDVFKDEAIEKIRHGDTWCVDVMPQDAMVPCYCENCIRAYGDRKLVPEGGYASELVWSNTVMVAKAITAAGLHGSVSQMAYGPYRNIPSVDIPGNVEVVLAVGGPWAESCPRIRDKQVDFVREWSGKLKRPVSWIWTYPMKNYGRLNAADVPQHAPRAYADYFRRMAPYIRGSFVQSNGDKLFLNYLNYYVFSRLAWNNGVDVEALLAEHHALMFGAGAGEMTRFFDRLEELWIGKVAIPSLIAETEDEERFCGPTEDNLWRNVYTTEVIAELSAYIDNALSHVAAGSLEARRIEWIRKEWMQPLAARAEGHLAARKEIRIGLVGLDTSHSIAFTKHLNVTKEKPEYRDFRVAVAYKWGSRDIVSSTNSYPEYCAKVKDMGVEIVDSLDTLISKCDAVLLETNDGREHLEQAKAVFRARRRVFIDKPLAASFDDCCKLVKAAREMGGEFFTSSALRYVKKVREAQAGKYGAIRGADCWTCINYEPTHSRFYWYGIHAAEPLYALLGRGCESVCCQSGEDGDVAVGRWSDGRLGVMRCLSTHKPGAPYGGMIFTERGQVDMGTYEGYSDELSAILEFFKTGKTPVTPEESLEIMAFMRAAELSLERGGAVVTIGEVMATENSELESGCTSPLGTQLSTGEFSSAGEFETSGCFVTWDDRSLRIGNSRFACTYVPHGDFLHMSGFRMSGGEDWVKTSSDATGRLRATCLKARPSVLGMEGIYVTVETGKGIAEIFVCPDSDGPLVSEKSVRPLPGIPVVNASSPYRIASERAYRLPSAAERVADMLVFAPPHLRVTATTVLDQTDMRDELVRTREWLMSSAEAGEELWCTSLDVRNVKTDDGMLFLRLAPMPASRPVSIPDFVLCGARHGMAIMANGYPVAALAYRGGETGRIAAMQRFQRCLRPYKPGRDGLFLSNTWGDGNGDGRINEKFIEQEIEAGARLGVDVIQIDDGWQKGRSANTRKKTGGRKAWSGFWAADPEFWTPDAERFPHGIKPLAAAAAAKGMAFGLWFGPDSSNDAANWEKDADCLLSFCRDAGVRYFKIDSLNLRSPAALANNRRFFDKVLRESHGDITFDLDCTAEIRPGYFGLPDIGPLFVENRYAFSNRLYWPHRTLRNLWTLARHVDPVRLRMELLNPRRNAKSWGDDPLAPQRYAPDVLFAVVMTASPLGWMELSGLDDDVVEAMRPLVLRWKRERERYHGGTVMPVGSCPDGFAWTGFLSKSADGQGGYALLFRELNGNSAFTLDVGAFGLAANTAEVIGGRGTATVTNGNLSVEVPAMLDYVWVKFK